jgi:hypothetical protein
LRGDDVERRVRKRKLLRGADSHVGAGNALAARVDE